MIGFITLIVGVIFLLYPMCCLGKNKKIHVLIAESVSTYLMIFIVVLSVLYYIDKPSLVSEEIISAVISIIVFFVFLIADRKKIVLDKIKLKKKSIFIGIIILLASGISIGTYECYGMGQDEGVYQMEAINILEGKDEWMQSLDEWATVDEELKGDYLNYAAWHLIGFDSVTVRKSKFNQVKNLPFVNVRKDKKGEFNGYFHGLPAYPALLAMTAQIIGIKYMSWCNILFFLCSLVFINEILHYFKVEWRIRGLLLLMLGVCPEVVWANMTTMTESMLLLIMTLFIYYLIVCEKEKKQAMIVLVLAAYSVFHISIFTMIPMFVLLLWRMYIMRDKLRYLIYTLMILLVYWLGYLFMLKMNPWYTYMNYNFGVGFLKKIIPQTILVLVATVTCIIITILLAILKKGINRIKEKYIESKRKHSIIKTIISIAVSLLVVVEIVLVIKSGFDDTSEIPTIWVFMVLTGILLIPVLMIKLISKKYELTSNKLAIIYMFIWCVLIYSSVIRPSIKYYYYYARYLVPLIPIVVILAGIVLMNNRITMVVTTSVAILLSIPFQYYIHANKDDSRMEWDIITSVTEYSRNFDEDTVVFMDPELLTYFYFPLRACSEASIKPIEMEDVYKEYEDGKVIYYLTNKEYEIDDNTLLVANGIREEDMLEDRVPILLLPTNYDEEQYMISLLNLSEIMEEKEIYSIDYSQLTIEDIENENGKVNVMLSGIKGLEEDDMINNGLCFISYHLYSEDGETLYFDNPRYQIGMIVCDSAEVFFDVKDYYTECEEKIDKFVFQFDLVEENEKWLSYFTTELPSVTFYLKDGEWVSDWNCGENDYGEKQT